MALLLYLILMFYALRLYKLNMPAIEVIPWSTPTTTMTYYIGFIAKTLNAVILAIDPEGKQIYVEIIVSLAIQVLYLVMLLMFISNFNSKIDAI